MERKRFVLLRHGSTQLLEWLASDRQSAKPEDWDDALSETGRQQAKEANAKLKGKAFDLVVVSPLMRAMETAALALEGRTDLDCRIDPRFREVNIRASKEYPMPRRHMGRPAKVLMERFQAKLSPTQWWKVDGDAFEEEKWWDEGEVYQASGCLEDLMDAQNSKCPAPKLAKLRQSICFTRIRLALNALAALPSRFHRLLLVAHEGVFRLMGGMTSIPTAFPVAVTVCRWPSQTEIAALVEGGTDTIPILEPLGDSGSTASDRKDSEGGEEAIASAIDCPVQWFLARHRIYPLTTMLPESFVEVARSTKRLLVLLCCNDHRRMAERVRAAFKAMKAEKCALLFTASVAEYPLVLSVVKEEAAAAELPAAAYECLHIDQHSATAEDAATIAFLFAAHIACQGLKLGIVSHDWHMPRALLNFHHYWYFAGCKAREYVAGISEFPVEASAGSLYSYSLAHLTEGRLIAHRLHKHKRLWKDMHPAAWHYMSCVRVMMRLWALPRLQNTSKPRQEALYQLLKGFKGKEEEGTARAAVRTLLTEGIHDGIPLALLPIHPNGTTLTHYAATLDYAELINDLVFCFGANFATKNADGARPIDLCPATSPGRAALERIESYFGADDIA